VAWRFDPGESLRDGFARVAMQAGERARRDLTATDIPLEQAVHRARRRFKKLRALIRLARPGLGEAYGRQNLLWRDAGRLLAASRDATVLLASFDAITAVDAELEAGNEVVGLRDGLASKFNGKGRETPDRRADALELIDAGTEELSRLSWPSSTGDLARGLQDSQARLRRSWRDVLGETTSESLHEWRKRVKDQATQLGLFRAILPADLQTRRADAKVLAELLGEEHDLSLLRDAVARCRATGVSRETRRDVLKAIDHRRAELRRTALEAGETFSAQSPKAVAHAIAEAWRGSAQR
jgi:CHAD domain-containing protein